MFGIVIEICGAEVWRGSVSELPKPFGRSFLQRFTSDTTHRHLLQYIPSEFLAPDVADWRGQVFTVVSPRVQLCIKGNGPGESSLIFRQLNDAKTGFQDKDFVLAPNQRVRLVNVMNHADPFEALAMSEPWSAVSPAGSFEIRLFETDVPFNLREALSPDEQRMLASSFIDTETPDVLCSQIVPIQTGSRTMGQWMGNQARGEQGRGWLQKLAVTDAQFGAAVPRMREKISQPTTSEDWDFYEKLYAMDGEDFSGPMKVNTERYELRQLKRQRVLEETDEYHVEHQKSMDTIFDEALLLIEEVVSESAKELKQIQKRLNTYKTRLQKWQDDGERPRTAPDTFFGKAETDVNEHCEKLVKSFKQVIDMKMKWIEEERKTLLQKQTALMNADLSGDLSTDDGSDSSTDEEEEDVDGDGMDEIPDNNNAVSDEGSKMDPADAKEGDNA